MGTRNLTAVFIDGEYKIAQYGQWDGYPSGQGVTILKFLSKPENIEKLKESLQKVRFIDADGKDKDFCDSYEKNSPEWSSDPDSRTKEQKHWFSKYASRDIGGEILESISTSDDDEILLFNTIDFAADSLFCEWAYVVDFDKNTLEVFEGFNHDQLLDDERFKWLEDKKNKEYYHVKLIKSYSIDSLPSEEVFLSDLEEKEDA